MDLKARAHDFRQSWSGCVTSEHAQASLEAHALIIMEQARLAGVRAGLERAAAECEERGQEEWDRMMAAKAAGRDWEFAHANTCCHVATQLAAALRAIDPESVGGE